MDGAREVMDRMIASETGTAGGDKIRMYRWTVSGEPGQMMWIDKSDLLVDRTYQRDPKSSDAKINRLAADWSWIACGTITVADRNGQKFVVDGQHRALAAMKRSDIRELPCIVFKTNAAAEEAGAFLRANRNRKPMTAIQAFKAMVASGDRAALIANEMIRDAGLRIDPKPGDGGFSAVGALLFAISTDEAAARRVWPVVVEACGAGGIHNVILRGMFYIERGMDGSLGEARWRKKAAAIGRAGLIEAAHRGAAFRGASGDKVWAEGIANALNKGIRVAPITLPERGQP